MSALGQKALISLLVDLDALDMLARDGLDSACIPDEELRKVVAFSLDYFHKTGREKAPTEAVLRQHYGDLLDDREITLGDSEESIEWAIEDLKAAYVHKEASSFQKAFATAMGGAEIGDRVEVLAQAATELVRLSLSLENREFSVDARSGMIDRLLAYDERAQRDDVIEGMRLGIPRIDEYTLGIRSGELAILASPPKTGKSAMLLFAALRGWQAGRVGVLYTLENSVEMTLDRLGCMATGIDPRDWEKGRCTEVEVERVRGWIAEMSESLTPLYVLQPDDSKRTVEQLVLGARLRGAEDLYIDQLSWVEHPDAKGLARHEQVREILRTLKTMISTGRHKMACLVAHQINREGAKAADKNGYLEMWHLAESAECERAADWVFGLYQSHDERAASMAKWQTLASRRAEIKHFLLTWRVFTGVVTVRSEITLDTSA